MNKNVWLAIVIILLSLLGYFLYMNPLPRPDIAFFQRKEMAKLPPQAPIVKDIQLDSLIVKESKAKRELKKLKIKVEQRKKDCEKNSRELFLQLNIVQGQMGHNLELVFEKSLNRPESELAFQKIQDILISKTPINLNIFYSLLFSLDICRPKKSMEFLDQAIDSLKNGDEQYLGELVPILIENIKDNLLGNQYSPINLSLVFGKIGRLIAYKIIKEPYANEILNLKLHFLNYEKEANRNIKRAEGSEQLRDLTIEHFSELKEIAIELRSILDNI